MKKGSNDVLANCSMYLFMNRLLASRWYLAIFWLILCIVPCAGAHVLCSLLLNSNQSKDLEHVLWYRVENHTPITLKFRSHLDAYVHSQFIHMI